MTTSKCSRAGCAAPALFLIDWANPMIHCGERRKTWLACAEHLSFLEDFVKARNFYIATRDLSSIVN